MASNGYKQLDLEYLKDYFLGDPTTIKELLSVYIPSVASDINLLKNAIEIEDIDGVAKSAHKLKTAFRYLGVALAGEIFEKIEKNAKTEKKITEIAILFEEGLRINLEINNDISQFLTQ